ncbi:flagellar basal-body rod protein FlgF [Halioxenophilus sp. WMMB6]|uniref:flagellar basal-body rod protein FlgF n=1 Tax=Halioxenophilus sp. WMMB6 TaxID=3073815 RepID=UPI00295EF63F|nr:flagellar basal-body rod protein FlgF [Halioxenophilus sp. WMMB6]
MDRAIYIAMTGAKNNMLAQTARANNLANANTTGFRADFEQARSQGVYYGSGLPTRAYSQTERPATDFTLGNMEETGRDLDLAIEGDGFFVVTAPDGSEALTRAGNLVIGADGLLQTGNGLPVMGSNGVIVLPPLEKIEIARDGSINIQVQGQGPESLAVIDRLRLVNPDVANLEKGGDGLIRLNDGSDLQEDPNVTVASGFLEGSNVNVIDEFTHILALARQYETQIKMMSTVEENSDASVRLLQLS